MTFPKSLALALALAAAPALGFAQEVSVGEALGADAATARQALEARGYEIRKTEAEDGEIEFYAVREGRRFEIELDAATGAVRKIEEKR